MVKLLRTANLFSQGDKVAFTAIFHIETDRHGCNGAGDQFP